MIVFKKISGVIRKNVINDIRMGQYFQCKVNYIEANTTFNMQNIEFYLWFKSKKIAFLTDENTNN